MRWNLCVLKIKERKQGEENDSIRIKMRNREECEY